MFVTRFLLPVPLVWAALLTPVLGHMASGQLPAQAQSATTAAPPRYETVSVVLPEGDAQAGRQAFLALKCTACHRVAGEPQFPAPVADSQGPDLDRTLKLRSAADVAEAIIVPSHSMSVRTSAAVKKRLRGFQGILSPMGDYSRVMTVRQLADLLVYLQALETVK